MSYLDEVRDTYNKYCWQIPRQYTLTMATRADARVAVLERELARERETSAALHRDLADPPPDVQELALKRCGHFEIVSRLIAERDQLRVRLAAIDALKTQE